MDFLTYTQYDDLLCEMFVDQCYLWFKTIKIQPNSQVMKIEKNKIENVLKSVINHNDLITAAYKVLQIPKIAQLLKGKTKEQVKAFVNHCQRYLMVYLENSGFEYSETTAYRDFLANRPGNWSEIRSSYHINEARDGCVIATKDYKPGDIIQNCTGSIVTLTEDDRKWLETETRDFSILYSHRKGSDCLFLGPARFVNHDCDPNCEFSAAGAQSITFKVIKHIKAGDEITVYYSDSYFGEDNKDCLCSQCRIDKSDTSDLPVKSSPKKRYNFRSKSNRSVRSVTPTSINPTTQINQIASPCSVVEDDASDVCSTVKHDITNQSNPVLNQNIKPPSPSSVTTSIAPGDGIPIDGNESSPSMCEWCPKPILFPLVRDSDPPVCQRCLRHFRLFSTIWPIRPETVKDPKRCLVQFFNEYVKDFSNIASTTRRTRIAKAALDPSLSATSRAALEADKVAIPTVKSEIVDQIIPVISTSNPSVSDGRVDNIIQSAFENSVMSAVMATQFPDTARLSSEFETLQPALLSTYYNQQAMSSAYNSTQENHSTVINLSDNDDEIVEAISSCDISTVNPNSSNSQKIPSESHINSNFNTSKDLSRSTGSLIPPGSSSKPELKQISNIQIIRSSSPNPLKITLKITKTRLTEPSEKIESQPYSPIQISSSPIQPGPQSVDNIIKSLFSYPSSSSNDLELVDIEANDHHLDSRSSNTFYSSHNHGRIKRRAKSHGFNDRIPVHMLQSRIAVLVDPLENDFTPWWPAILVPDAEVDDTMGYPNGPPPGMRLVRYFEDSSYSVCSLQDIRLFTPPYGTYAKCLERNPELAQDPAYRKACAFLDHGIVPLNLPWPGWRKEMVLTGIRPFGRACLHKYTFPTNTPVHVWDPRSPKKIESAVIRDIEFLDNPIRHGLYYYVHYPKWGRKFDEWIRPTNLILDEELSKVRKTLQPIPPPKICSKKYRKTIYDHCMSYDQSLSSSAEPSYTSKRQHSDSTTKSKKTKKTL